MGVANGRGYQEVGVASGWNLWVWLVSVVVRRYIIDILIIIITFPYSTCISYFLAASYGVPFVSKLKMMLVFTIHAGIYDSCWYLRSMLVFILHAGTVNTSTKCKYQHES